MRSAAKVVATAAIAGPTVVVEMIAHAVSLGRAMVVEMNVHAVSLGRAMVVEMNVHVAEIVMPARLAHREISVATGIDLDPTQIDPLGDLRVTAIVEVARSARSATSMQVDSGLIT
jgi:hypothetical protein